MQGLACPKCQSDNVRRLSLIHREGTAIIDTRTSGIGVGVGGGALGIGGAAGSTKGTQQTILAQQAAPPTIRSAAGGWVMTIIGVVLVMVALGDLWEKEITAALAMLFCVGAGLAALGWRSKLHAESFMRTTYPELLRRWENSFLCNRCGEIFVWSD